MDGKINIRVGAYSGEKTEELVCNWCKLPHAVEPQYKQDFLERAARKIEAENVSGVDPKQMWTCGRCMLVLSGLDADAIRTDCPEHDVPEPPMRCDHPWHDNPGLMNPCPECGAERE